MAHKFFLHGVPDTPHMWQPLLGALNLPKDSYSTPALPGFIEAAPHDFSATKEAYVAWYIEGLEAEVKRSGPVDLIGHDWGALITLRVASLRPDLVRTWCVANAVPHPEYRWHRMAQLWQTPLIGELIMALTRKETMCKALHAAGLPADMASYEASYWSPQMRTVILKLYRSAKNASQDWWPEIHNLPAAGLVFWGEDDPYVPVWVAEKFCAEIGVPLARQTETGHWSIVERADQLAADLTAFWSNSPSQNTSSDQDMAEDPLRDTHA